MPELSASAPQVTHDSANEVANVVQRLEERLQVLEKRVAALEGTPVEGVPDAAGVEGAAVPRKEPVAETWAGFPSVRLEPGGMATVLGKAVVGFAGAYLLRALAETSGLPKIPVILVAIAYAGLWMVWAIRNREKTFASITYGVTSTLILCPLLWETTVRFQFLSPGFAGAVLAAFFGFTVIKSWAWNLRVLPWIATFATVSTACALIFATHDLVPLIMTLLVICIGCEIATALGQHSILRFLPAIAADAAVCLAIDLLAGPGAPPEGYAPAAAATVVALWTILLLTYTGSIGLRAFYFSKPIAYIDIWQGALAFVVAAFGAFRSPGQALVPVLGAFFLVLAAGCYWGALSRFSDATQGRNRRISATWAAMLLIAGSVLLFPASVQVLLLSVGSLVATFLYTRTAKLSLGLHASLYLGAATALSSVPQYLVGAMAGSVPRFPGVSVWLILCTAVLCYGMGARREEDKARRRLLWVYPAALVGFGSIALAVTAVTAVTASGMDLSASKLSVVRTVLNCGLALALAYLGLRWRRAELGWLAYVAVVFGTLKLLFEDFRIGNASSLVVSLLFYGLVLILLPRLMRRAKADLKTA